MGKRVMKAAEFLLLLACMCCVNYYILYRVAAAASVAELLCLTGVTVLLVGWVLPTFVMRKCLDTPRQREYFFVVHLISILLSCFLLSG